MTIKAILFDFGGVLADEGFRNALDAIGERQGIDGVFDVAEKLIYESGYVLGLCEERQFWEDLRLATGIRGTDAELREEVLKRFTLRPAVLDKVRALRDNGFRTALLSDQTNWLDELDRRTPFYLHFDRVFNSCRLHKGKRDTSIFTDVCRELDVAPDEAVFVDDNPANVERARSVGMKAILFDDAEGALKEIDEEIAKVASG